MKTLQPTKRWTKSPLPQLAWCTGGDTIYPNPSRGTVGVQTLVVCLLGVTYVSAYVHAYLLEERVRRTHVHTCFRMDAHMEGYPM